MSGQQVPATEIEDGAMPRLAVLAIGFDYADVFVLDAFAAGGADYPQEHGSLRNLSLPATSDESDHGNQKQREMSRMSVPTILTKLPVEPSKVNGLAMVHETEKGNMG